MDSRPRQNLGIQDDGAFDDWLRSAKVEVPLPGAFQSEVWRRIAVEQESTPMARLASLLDSILSALNRPVAATASVLLMVSAGLWLGSLGVPPARDGKFAYVESVSPFVPSHQGEDR
ncbi:MAG: hypothetical protein ACKV19_25230 [Verrucomicrobiales bacterium]